MTPNVQIGALVTHAWNALKSNPWPLIGGFLIIMVVSFSISFFAEVFLTGGLYVLAQIVGTFMGIYLTLGLVSIALAVWRGQPANMGMLFDVSDRVLTYLGAYLIFVVAMIVGFLLLVVPGIWVVLALWPFLYIIVDQEEVGPINALLEAKRLTSGDLFPVFLLFLTTTALVCAGYLACLVGVLVAGPFAMLVQAGFYDEMVKAKGKYSPTST